MEKLAYNSGGHTFSSDLAAMRFERKKEALIAAIYAPVTMSTEKAAALLVELRSGDESRVVEGMKQLETALKTVPDTLGGRTNLITERYKLNNTTVMPMMGRVIETFINEYSEISIDNGWQNWIFTDSLEGANKATLYDVISHVVAYSLADDTDDIPESKYKSSTWVDVHPEWYGAKVLISRDVVDTDPMSSINNIVIAIRYAMLQKRTEVAYTRTQAAITQAISDGNTTAYTASSVAKTLNAAYLALYLRNINRGYRLVAGMPVALVGNESHRAIVEPVFDITINSQNNNSSAGNNGTIRVMYPFNRHYTFNLAANLGNSGSKVAIILPFRKVRGANYRTMKIESEAKIENNAQVVLAREAYNFSIDTDQIQVATIE